MPQRGEDPWKIRLLLKKRALHLAKKRGLLRNDQERDVLQRGPSANDRKEIHSLSGKLPKLVQGKENQGVARSRKRD